MTQARPLRHGMSRNGVACHEEPKRWSRPVSRVLYVLRRDSHSSRPDVAAWLQQPTREQRGPRYRSPIWSCSEWGLPCRTTLAPYAVRSYRTLSPLPDPLARPSAVCSLLHWPSAHAAQELPGTLPCGARTFLDALACDATARPTPPPSLVGAHPVRDAFCRCHQNAPRARCLPMSANTIAHRVRSYPS